MQTLDRFLEERRALKSSSSNAERAKERAPRNPRPVRCCVVCTLLVFVEFVVLVVAAKHRLDVVSSIEVRPTSQEWSQWVACTLEQTTCDTCALPVRALMFPPSTGARVAAVATHSHAGAALRFYMEAATRVATGTSERCFAEYQVLRGFLGECADASRWSSFLLTTFEDATRATSMQRDAALYNPTHFVFVFAHPLRTIMAAYDELVRCGPTPRDASVACLTTTSPLTAQSFADPAWREFAPRKAREWADSVYDYSVLLRNRTFGKVTAVVYEELLVAPEDVAGRVLEFLRPAFDVMPSEKRARACISRAAATHALFSDASHVSVDMRVAFQPDAVRESVCAEIGPAVRALQGAAPWDVASVCG